MHKWSKLCKEINNKVGTWKDCAQVLTSAHLPSTYHNLYSQKNLQVVTGIVAFLQSTGSLFVCIIGANKGEVGKSEVILTVHVFGTTCEKVLAT
jgi:hypothetical protein